MDDLKNKKILIIEDNEVLGDILLKKLQTSGYNNAELVRDGKEGLERVRSLKPDLVLLDIILPHMNGYEILQALNDDTENPMPPVIIISNSGQPVELSRVLELGVKDYLVKADFTPEEVLKKVEEQLKKSSNGTQKAGGHKDISILSVEDDNFLRDLLARKLAHEQYNIKTAVDGETGLEAAREQKFSVILLDLILPGMSGFDTLEQIRKDSMNKDTPIIVLSNLGQESDIERAKKLGANDFLIKAHFGISEIIEKMNSVLDAASSQ